MAKMLVELKREFLEHCELDKGQSLLTISNYSRYLDRFLNFLEVYQSNIEKKNGNAEATVKNGPGEITQEAVREYRLHINRLHDQRGQELKKSTQNYHMLALRAFLRYLAWRGITSLAPEKIPVAKQGDREVTFLEGEEVQSIISLPDTSELSGLRDRAILELLFSTGLRVSEAAALDVEDINFERGEISVLGKGKKLRVVFLSESALLSIREYLSARGISVELSKNKNSQPLFLSNRDERLTVRSIERIVSKFSSRAGITKKVSPHTLRHSFATDLLIAGADIRSVQSMLGHSSITTTQVYTHVTDQHLREIHQKFHGKQSNTSKVEGEKQN